MSVMETTAQNEPQTNFAERPVVYEVGFLLLPTIPEEKIQDIAGSIRSLIEKNGGVVISTDLSSVRALTYSMAKLIEGKNQKFDHAYFGWVKFDLSNDAITSIKKEVDALGEVLRTLVIKTVRENTLISGKVPQKDGAKAKEGAEAGTAEVKAPANDEEIDKSIDALVMS